MSKQETYGPDCARLRMDENEIQTKYEKNKVVIKYCLENIVCKKTDHIDLFFDILNVNRWRPKIYNK